MSENKSFENVFILIQRYFKQLVIIALVGAVAGIIFSMPAFIKPRFESTAVVYPINHDLFSDESETEQMVQLFDFAEIREAVIDRFQLWERHGLKPGAPEYRHWVKLLYDERVSIRPTKYESVVITCQDEDPLVAKQMVEEILIQYDETNRKIGIRRHKDYLDLKTREYDQLQLTIDSMRHRLAQLREGTLLLDMESQSERLTEGYVNMLEKGVGGDRLAEVKKMMAQVGEKGDEITMLTNLIEGLKDYHATVVAEVNREKVKVNDMLTYAHLVVAPEQSDKKAYPVRWLIVVMSALGALVAGVIFFAVRSRFV